MGVLYREGLAALEGLLQGAWLRMTPNPLTLIPAALGIFLAINLMIWLLVGKRSRGGR